MKTESPPNRVIISVTDLNRSARRLLEGEFPMVFVEGEISNLARPSSGHWYFTLKDDQSQLRCAMFRNRNQRVRFAPENGLQIIVRGKISLYEGRGEFQLIAEHLEEAGDGALRRAFEKLKARLQEEGLFDLEAKKEIPALPRHVAVVTSATGAAIRDVLTVMRRRFPAIRISILPVPVQGDDSPARIVQALDFANRYEETPFDVILLTRGGGSLEDLWSFNTESVARAVFASEIPVVCAVGHESDITIADFVADLRAPTPSAAAELIAPDATTWTSRLSSLEQALLDGLARNMETLATQIRHFKQRLRHPGERLQDLAQRLDDLEIRMRQTLRHRLEKLDVENRKSRLVRAMDHFLSRQNGKVAVLAGKMQALSPLATLERGYAIVSTESGHVLTRATEVNEGDRIVARLMDGKIAARVESLESDGK